MKRRYIPSEHLIARTDAEDAQKALEEQKKEEALALRRAVNRILDSEDGRVLWRWIHGRCGFVKPSLAYFAQGDVAPMKTECLAAIRDLYLDLRALASPDLRVKAEDFAENGTQMEHKKGGK
jgi:hypothetical protein